jgi:hypothetical protein
MAKPTPLTLLELKELLPRLQATVEILVGQAGGSRTAGGEATKARRGGRKARNGAATQELQDKLVKTLKGSPKGLSLGEVIDKVGADRNAIKYHLRQLRAQKKARVAGDRKFARWYAQK